MALDQTTAIVVGCLMGAVFLITFGSCLIIYCQSGNNENIERATSRSKSSYDRVSQTANTSYEVELNTDSEVEITDIEKEMLNKNSKYIWSRGASTLSSQEIEPILKADDISQNNPPPSKMQPSSDPQPNVFKSNHPKHHQQTAKQAAIKESPTLTNKIPKEKISKRVIPKSDERQLSTLPNITSETKKQNVDGSMLTDQSMGTVANNDIHEKHVHDQSNDDQTECHPNVAGASLLVNHKVK